MPVTRSLTDKRSTFRLYSRAHVLFVPRNIETLHNTLTIYKTFFTLDDLRVCAEHARLLRVSVLVANGTIDHIYTSHAFLTTHFFDNNPY